MGLNDIIASLEYKSVAAIAVFPTDNLKLIKTLPLGEIFIPVSATALLVIHSFEVEIYFENPKSPIDTQVSRPFQYNGFSLLGVFPI